MTTIPGWKLVPCEPDDVMTNTLKHYLGLSPKTALREAIAAAPVPPGDAADYVLMPRALTAENGAKAALIGEFKIQFYQKCPDCDEETDGCQECNGSCEMLTSITIDWPTIKTIYAAAVAACALEQKP